MLVSQPRKEDFWNQLVETVPAGVVHVGKNGSVLRANAEACRVLGLSYDALTQRYTTDFETQTILEDGTPVRTKSTRSSRRATGAVPDDWRGRPDGTTAWALFSASPIRGQTLRKVPRRRRRLP